VEIYLNKTRSGLPWRRLLELLSQWGSAIGCPYCVSWEKVDWVVGELKVLPVLICLRSNPFGLGYLGTVSGFVKASNPEWQRENDLSSSVDGWTCWVRLQAVSTVVGLSDPSGDYVNLS